MLPKLLFILIITSCAPYVLTVECSYKNNSLIKDGVCNFTSFRSSRFNVICNNEDECNREVLVCIKSRYRTVDGSCNNLRNPTWGTPNAPYDRLLPYKYGDGYHSFPLSSSGRTMPNVREIRLKIFSGGLKLDENHTLVTMQWGQLVTHDLSRSILDRPNIPCCDPSGRFREKFEFEPGCAPINISRNDPIYGPLGAICMNFYRTSTTKDIHKTRGCPSQPLSSVTSYMDLSNVYGNSKTATARIRAGNAGRLLSVIVNNNEVFPNDPVLNPTCALAKSLNSVCFLSGDDRLNQNLQLAILQIILLREHNRIASILNTVNPHWNDEIIFQETRRILIAVYQHINYYEYLPILVGLEYAVKNNLTYVPYSEQGYVNDYNPNINPAVYDEHSSAAFKVFHSSIRGHLQKYHENRQLVGKVRLSDSYNNPIVLTEGENLDSLAIGMATQLQGRCDQYIDEEVSNCLFRGENKFGSDLVAIDILRGRDHGLPSYVDTRAACGLSVPKTFSDMHKYISPENVEKLEEIYETVADVELMVAGPLEFHVSNALTGPTFVSIITKQFYKTRVSDRYFYENGIDADIAFSPSQLQSIRQGASLARLFCDNIPSIKSMQPKAFESISRKNNLVPCHRLPAVDFTLWKEIK